MEDILIKGAPAEYSCSVGILDKLEEKLAARKIRRALVVTGKKSWKAVQPYFPELNSVELLFVFYTRANVHSKKLIGYPKLLKQTGPMQ